jgi:DNA-binding IclR family transcriptional regulator
MFQKAELNFEIWYVGFSQIEGGLGNVPFGGRPARRGGRAPPKREDPALKSVRKVVDVLECFSRVERHLSLAEIARKTGLPKPTAHRVLASLREVGFIEQDGERESYRLGIRLFTLGSTVLANMDLHREATPFVEQLTRLSGEGVHLCVFDGTQMVTVDHREADGRSVDSVTTITGSPAYCTGVGKAALAFQSAEAIAQVVRAGLKRFTRNTITVPERLSEELAKIRRRGYAVDNAEHQPGVRCVAAPIRNASGEVFAAISVSGRAVRVTDDRIDALAELVMDAAEHISRQLGYRAQTEE